VFEDGPDLYRELLPTLSAFPETMPYALLGVGRDAVRGTNAAAMRALRAVRPDNALQEPVGGFLVTEIRAVQNAHQNPLKTPVLYTLTGVNWQFL
jgi:hypothetical protein